MELQRKNHCSRAGSTIRNGKRERGASVTELLIVIAIILIITSMSLFALTGQKAMYKTDDQALKIIDVLRAAALRAVTQRQTIRVEINLTKNTVRMIDENLPATATDDVLVRSLTLESTNDVKLSAQPTNVTTLPPSPSNFPVALYAPSVHTLSSGNNVCTIRFNRNGTVVNAGTNATGTNSVITSTTLYIWPPLPSDATKAKTARQVRAITVFGSTGNIRFWKFNGTSFVLG